MDPVYNYFESLAAQLPDIPPDSIVSRTLYSDEQIKVVLFGFAPGQELSEHTASQAALLSFVEGEAELIVGRDQRTAGPGTWVRMQPRLPHSVRAKTQVVMLLILLKASG
jgi:quercetin dioxygenase-like cupin family protein